MTRKVLTFTRPHALAQLHDELLAVCPQWFVATNTEGRRIALATVSGDGTTVELTVPESADAAVIGAVVQAHIPLAEVTPRVIA